MLGNIKVSSNKHYGIVTDPKRELMTFETETCIQHSRGCCSRLFKVNNNFSHSPQPQNLQLPTIASVSVTKAQSTLTSTHLPEPPPCWTLMSLANSLMMRPTQFSKPCENPLLSSSTRRVCCFFQHMAATAIVWQKRSNPLDS